MKFEATQGFKITDASIIPDVTKNSILECLDHYQSITIP